jgi:hypothetical protein
LPCFTPLTAYRSRADGKLTFKAADGYTDKPIDVACGQCRGCRIARSATWATRILHEAQTFRERGKPSSFLTLTYDDEHLPTDNGLQRADLQKFFKRLRKTGRDIRYFACGEYGEQSLRPHYHAILFGEDFADDRVEIKVTKYGTLYYSRTLEKIWNKGQISIGQVTRQSATYVAKYCIKCRTGPLAEREYYRRSGTHEWQVEPEFGVMSLKPAIGTDWLRHYKSDVFPSGELISSGKHVAIPKLYLRLLKEGKLIDTDGLTDTDTQTALTRDEECFHQLSERRIAFARTKRSDNTPERREVKHLASIQDSKRKRGTL